jgi:hypothetical protein
MFRYANKHKVLMAMAVAVVCLGPVNTAWASPTTVVDSPPTNGINADSQEMPTAMDTPGDRAAFRRIARLVRFFLGKRGVLVRGEITEITRDGLTLDIAGKEISVSVDEETRLYIQCVTNPDPDDLIPGALALVGGIREQDGTIAARGIVVIRNGPIVRCIVGKITVIEDGNLVLAAHSGRTGSVPTDGDTHFLSPGSSQGGVSDLLIGTVVAVQGPGPVEGEIPSATTVIALRESDGTGVARMGRLTEIQYRR